MHLTLLHCLSYYFSNEFEIMVKIPVSKSRESQLRVCGKDLGERICEPSTQGIDKNVWVYEFSEQRGEVSMRFSNEFSNGSNESKEL